MTAGQIAALANRATFDARHDFALSTQTGYQEAMAILSDADQQRGYRIAYAEAYRAWSHYFLDDFGRVEHRAIAAIAE